ncbi:MAG: hypothetical protein CSA81_08390, partial [Acidobacteria bacterium]
MITIAALGQGRFTGEKEPDNSEYLGPFDRAGSVTQTIDGSQVFDRRYSVSLDLNCLATSSDSSHDGVGYVVFDLVAPGGEALDAVVTSAGTTVSDTVMFVYCDFDPANPADSLVFWDDDDGVEALSAIVPSDGVTLAAGTYKLVVSGFNSSHTGDVTVEVGGDYTIQAGGAGGAGVPTMSQWGMILFASLLVLSGILVIKRK